MDGGQKGAGVLQGDKGKGKGKESPASSSNSPKPHEPVCRICNKVFPLQSQRWRRYCEKNYCDEYVNQHEELCHDRDRSKGRS